MNPSDLIAVFALVISGVSPSLMYLTMRKDAAKEAHNEGERDGKIDAALVVLTDIAKDHEARLRAGKL